MVFITYALIAKSKKFVTYAPYLLGQFPSTEYKLVKTDELNAEVGSHLITDYRSCRGCQFDHSVFFVNPNEEYANHAFIEMMTRTISKLDIFVYPFIKDTKTCLRNILDSWNEEEDEIEIIKIETKLNRHRCTISIGERNHVLRIEKSHLFQQVQQSVQEGDLYKKKDTLQ